MQSIAITTTKEAHLESFQISVRNSLSKVSNLIGLPPEERELLMESAFESCIEPHWLGLKAEAQTQGGTVTDWVWNRHQRRATRELLERWLNT